MLEAEFYNKIDEDNHIKLLEGPASIYSNNIIHNRIEALIDIFPAVTACLSEAYIRQVARDFCTSHAAPDGNLNLYGKEFGAYLAQQPACEPYRFIRDLADFEYEIRRLLYIEDEYRLNAQEFSKILAQDSEIKLSNACFLFSSIFFIDKISDYCLAKIEELPELSDIGQMQHFLLYRDPLSFKIFILTLSSEQAEIIPILKSKGISGLSDIMIAQETIKTLLNILLEKRLWISIMAA